MQIETANQRHSNCLWIFEIPNIILARLPEIQVKLASPGCWPSGQ
jgi:hypothetical protein